MREVQSPWASCFSDSDLGSYQLATVMLLRLVATAAATAQTRRLRMIREAEAPLRP